MKVLGIEVGPEGIRVKERDLSDEEMLGLSEKMKGASGFAFARLIESLQGDNEVLAASALAAIASDVQDAFEALDTLADLCWSGAPLDRIDPEKVVEAQFGLLRTLRDLTLAALPDDENENEMQREALNGLAKIRRTLEQREWNRQKWEPEQGTSLDTNDLS